MENGTSARNMEKGPTFLLMGTLILANTKMESLMVMEYILGVMDLTTREIFRMDLSMEKALGERIKIN